MHEVFSSTRDKLHLNLDWQLAIFALGSGADWLTTAGGLSTGLVETLDISKQVIDNFGLPGLAFMKLGGVLSLAALLAVHTKLSVDQTKRKNRENFATLIITGGNVLTTWVCLSNLYYFLDTFKYLWARESAPSFKHILALLPPFL